MAEIIQCRKQIYSGCCLFLVELINAAKIPVKHCIFNHSAIHTVTHLNGYKRYLSNTRCLCIRLYIAVHTDNKISFNKEFSLDRTYRREIIYLGQRPYICNRTRVKR